MEIEQWWPGLARDAQDWLIDNNGDSLTAAIAARIVAAGGRATAGEPLPDHQVDWIETVANDEVPE